MEIDYNEVFELETGAEEQEPAAPAEEGAEEQEVAEPAVDESGESHKEDTPQEGPQKTEEDAKYAAARRKAEQERDAAIEKARKEAREEAQRTIDEAIRSSGLTDPYTGRPITTKAELDAYQARHQEEQARNLQKKAGLTQEQYQAFVNSLPEVRQARQAQEQAEKATREVREQAAKSKIEEQLKEISAIDPTIKGMGDLTKMENYQRFYELVKRGNTLTDAYKLANYDVLTQKAAEASRKTAITAAKSKEHLSPTTQRGAGAVSVPADIKAEYKAFNPDATDDEIQKHYQKYMKK